MSLGKTLNANFLTGTLCDAEDSTGVCFTTKNTKQKWHRRCLRKWVWVTLALCLMALTLFH